MRLRLLAVALAAAYVLHVTFWAPARNACAVLASMPRYPETLPRVVHMQWPAQRPMGAVQNKTYRAYARLFPGWELRVWDDAALERFMRDTFPGFAREVWASFPHMIQRLDVARYLILFKYGGLYSDLDYEPLEYFGDLLSDQRVTLPESPIQHDEWVQNSLMASPRDHPVWLWVVQELEARRGGASVPEDTGCGMLSRVVRAHAEHVHVLPCEVFMRQAPLSFLQGDVLSALVQKLIFPALGWAKHCGAHGAPCMMAAHFGTSLRPAFTQPPQL